MEQSKFREIVNSYCLQAVSGVYMSLYRLLKDNDTCEHKMNAIINDERASKYMLWVYLNQCWTSYHKKNDHFVVETVDSLLSQKIIIHTSCIFHLFTDYCTHLMKCLKIYSKNHQFEKLNVDDMRNVINNLLKQMLDNEMNYEKCGSECKIYNYKENEDFIIINK